MWVYKRSSELYHEDREDHKYIAKVKVKNGKFRYFYDKEEYRRYLLGDKVDKLKDRVKDTTENIQELIRNTTDKIDKPNNKAKSVTDGKKFVDKHLKDDPKGLILFIPESVISMGKEFVARSFHKVKDLFDKDDPEDASKNKPKTNTEKLKDPDERADYNKRLEYQKNEPAFMKDVPDIPDDVIYTKFEDQNEINEVYDPYDSDTSMNCSNCSAAYELRRRGYDVEAKLVDETYNGQDDRVYDYFEGAEYIAIKDDGSSFVHSEEFVRKVWSDKGVNTLDVLKHNQDAEFYLTEHSYTPEAIEKAITDNSPPGSRGFIDVCWTSGGGHSIVYEVDSKGKVTIRDSQTYDEYSVTELAHRVNRVQIARTDHLELKEEILNTVTTNTKKKRKYYVDQQRLEYYYD